jgi:hypothetical protein
MLQCLNAKEGNENIFKPKIENECLDEISNDDSVKAAYYATSKYLLVTSAMLRNRNIHKFTCKSTPPDGKTHGLIDHILVDRRRHSEGARCPIFHTSLL